MDVSIIIVNYNTKDILANCLDSIKDNTSGVDYEVIVVDNASQDGSQSLIKDKYSWVNLIESDENLGFGRANNLGMEAASGKYFFLLNSDTLLRNNAVKIFFDYAESHDDFGALGCILLGKDGKTCHSYGQFITPSSELRQALAKYLRFLKDKRNTSPEKINTPLEVDYITGADLWVPRKVYEQVGGFDPRFFMYCEEVDWQKRMKDNQLKRIVIPGPEIIHLEGGSDNSKTNLWTPKRLRNLYHSKKEYQNKHFNKVSYPFFRILYLVLQLPSILLLGIFKSKDYFSVIKTI